MHFIFHSYMSILMEDTFFYRIILFSVFKELCGIHSNSSQILKLFTENGLKLQIQLI